MEVANRAQQFEFVSVSGQNIKGDTATRKRVRSRAQSDYRRRQKAPAPKPPLKAVFDVEQWLRNLSKDASHALPLYSDKQITGAKGSTTATTYRQEASLFNKSGSEIFALLTPAERNRAQGLWNHLYGGTCIVFKSMVEIGFLNILQGSAALSQMLASSAWHMGNEGSSEPSCQDGYVVYSVMATSALRGMLCQPGRRVSVETIIAIITFAAYANLRSDPQLINIHLDGLLHTLSTIGGLLALDDLPAIRMMLYWIDLRASYLADTAPRFPQPLNILSKRRESALQLPMAEPLVPSIYLHDDLLVCHIWADLREVTILIDGHALEEGDAFWTNVLFPQFHLAPIMHNLLSMPRVGELKDTASTRREIFRVAAIIFTYKLWATFGMGPEGAAKYFEHLRDALRQNELMMSWGKDNDFLHWILSVCTVCSVISGHSRRLFQAFLHEHEVASDSATRTASQVWSDAALGPFPWVT